MKIEMRILSFFTISFSDSKNKNYFYDLCFTFSLVFLNGISFTNFIYL